MTTDVTPEYRRLAAISAAKVYRQAATRALATAAPSRAAAEALLGILICQIEALEAADDDGPLTQAAADLVAKVEAGLIPPPVADGGRWAAGTRAGDERRCPKSPLCGPVCLLGC